MEDFICIEIEVQALCSINPSVDSSHLRPSSETGFGLIIPKENISIRQPSALACNQQVSSETLLSASLGNFRCKIKRKNCPETKHCTEHMGNKIRNGFGVVAKNWLVWIEVGALGAVRQQLRRDLRKLKQLLQPPFLLSTRGPGRTGALSCS